MLTLLAGSIVFILASIATWMVLKNPIFFDVAVMLLIWCGLVTGTFQCYESRKSLPIKEQKDDSSPSGLKKIKFATIALGSVGCVGGLFLTSSPKPSFAWSLAAFILGAVGAFLSFTISRYFSSANRTTIPESVGLSQSVRIIAWYFVSSALCAVLLWWNLTAVVKVIHFVLLLFIALSCLELFSLQRKKTSELIFCTNLKTFSTFGRSFNPLSSILDTAQEQFGIDLRSTWALLLVRRSIEPLIVFSFLVGWLSTSLTVVGIHEVGLIERLGARVMSPALKSGIHLHWPWPIDRVVLIPVDVIQTLHIGHETEEEEEGPEDVLWARLHADSEYTLLLGDGRDLIAIDATVQFKIFDPAAWRYHNQNPAEALRAIAYRAVMKSTVNRTLTDTLSENVSTLTAQMKNMVQADADALGLGVNIVSFAIGGMHPPVHVAADYQAVVSASLGKVTAAVEAKSDANKILSNAKTEALIAINEAKASDEEAMKRAYGDAWGFTALLSQYKKNPEEYRFRRHLESLESSLDGHSFAVVDDRFERDGGEIWVTK